MTKPTAAVFFDLDGTLLDTAPDMVGAVLKLCDEEQHPYPDQNIARSLVSNGSLGLVNLAFGADQDEADRSRRIERFLAIYAEYICVDSHLFEHIEALLEVIESFDIPWGIVTNKPGWLTEPLLQQLKLDQRIVCQFSGDTLPQRKPHPAPLFAAAEAAGVNPEQCLYLGDAERDIEAGNAAGMTTLTALWGYIEANQDPIDWGANGMLVNPLEAVEWIVTESTQQT